MVALATSPADVFFSYSPRDEDLRPKIETHLDALKRQGVIRNYQGFALGGGKERREATAARLREARVVLLLVSADFLSADAWLSPEIREAIARHEAGECRVIPVILRPCAWEKTLLGKLPPLPSRARPVTSYPNQSEAFTFTPAGAPSTVQFTVTSPNRSVATTVPLTVTDACGGWQTLVGGGADLGVGADRRP